MDAAVVPLVSYLLLGRVNLSRNITWSGCVWLILPLKFSGLLLVLLFSILHPSQIINVFLDILIDFIMHLDIWYISWYTVKIIHLEKPTNNLGWRDYLWNSGIEASCYFARNRYMRPNDIQKWRKSHKWVGAAIKDARLMVVTPMIRLKRSN